ncbi:MAG: hypothetical protein COW00_14590 [Bdellovibrio sp. CG12_big_fil_rev_8_21_14_0_65_39_13]|nr:MAG: hypothetical protein COW78_07665 [Bdellovibrio sp. CG22_combo_CG10-13_8_21_14_all_39_27]PIQ58840.1 MAG: hypothetical protein COW00_14590 [Bdellovibrio sp. CG12_big_fil_rev_8_21_14_0_65_39_13]PIR35482.1 MAG: hypothetical protein COV37_08360 [Bdellovibrio sp. CG11_big_fil_rev_8_21_14_0_20_39_38]
MKFKHYEFICIIVSLYLGYEYAIFNKLIVSASPLQMILKKELDPTPGYPLSYFLGILGFGIMCVTNFYIMRKRLGLFKNWGTTNGWLDFHIFCGLIGPIFIIFHSNFKIDGLVSISFWSMIICSSSGIVGRYFYIQTLKKSEELKKYIHSLEEKFKKTYQKKFNEERMIEIFAHVDNLAGVSVIKSNPLAAFISSLRSDILLMFVNPGKPFGLSKNAGRTLKRIGIEKRRSQLLVPFKKLLGYWHSFHLPFAIFMYVVAIIHIATALLFGVKH